MKEHAKLSFCFLNLASLKCTHLLHKNPFLVCCFLDKMLRENMCTICVVIINFWLNLPNLDLVLTHLTCSFWNFFPLTFRITVGLFCGFGLNQSVSVVRQGRGFCSHQGCNQLSWMSLWTWGWLRILKKKKQSIKTEITTQLLMHHALYYPAY